MKKPRDPAVTHKIMSSIHSTDTRPELLLRRALWSKGYRYRVHYKGLPGKPDVVFTKAKVAVFCDGDFWHGHNWALRGMASLEEELSTYTEFWKEKILRNIRRDANVTEQLRNEGWTVIRRWESDIKKDLSHCIDIIERAFLSKR